MRIGVFVGEASGDRTAADALMANARDIEARGFATAWVPHIPWSLDALNALTLAAMATDHIELGTAVVPTYPRHPMSMAQAAMSVQAVSNGRLALGIGPSHPTVIENMYGLTYERPAAHTAEYVQVIRACFATNPENNFVSWSGDFFNVNAMLEVPGSTPAPILVAALAPKMLSLTGRYADGTITYWADERAIGEHVVPRITAAAEAAGRPSPRVVAGLPVAVVDDVDTARERAAKLFTAYESISTYQRILAHGDSAHPVDTAIIGDEKTVVERVRRFADLGATDFLGSVLGLDDDREASRQRTLDVLASLL